MHRASACVVIQDCLARIGSFAQFWSDRVRERREEKRRGIEWPVDGHGRAEARGALARPQGLVSATEVE